MPVTAPAEAMQMPGQPIVIVGAGMAGLAAANRLQDTGFPVLVLDKARGIGGRVATRRVGTGVADHGAQFFTAREPPFIRLVAGWLTRGVAQEWSRGFADPSGQIPPDGHPRYRGTRGMTDIPKHLSSTLAIRLKTRVAELRANPDRTWSTRLHGGETINSPAILLTPPLPQSLRLLEAGRVLLPGSVSNELEAIAYDPCLALIAVLPSPSKVPQPGAVRFAQGPIAWIADNRIKGISPRATTVTIHAGPELSRSLWDREDGQVAARLLELSQAWLGSEPVEVQVHRWRFSQPTSLHPHRTIVLTRPAPLAFAGDAFAGPRVEGAALSGLAAADGLAKVLTREAEA